MNAILRKLTVLCLVLVLAGAAWAGDCSKSKSADNGNGDCKKACDSKDKDGKCDKDKAGCEKSGSTETEKSTDNAG